MASLPTLPGTLKPIQHYLKTASEHDQRDPVVAYYCRFYAAQKAMELDKTSHDSKVFLMSLMDMLEKSKSSIKDHDSMQNELVAQAHVESYALKLFLYADNEDRAGNFGKNVIKSFYTAGMLMDVLSCFGDISEDLEKNRKYAKWKAAYIHNCIKKGETPVAGPLEGTEGPADMSNYLSPGGAAGFSGGAAGYSQPGPSTSHQPHVPPPTINLPPMQGHQEPPRAPASTPVQPSASAGRWEPPPSSTGVQLQSKDYELAMKFCKFANSALQYEDANTAIQNLSKALNLLTTGQP